MIINLKKYTFFIYLLIAANLNALAKDSLATKPLFNNSSQIMVLEIKDAEKIFKHKEEDWWDKYSSAIIALITVFGSAFISYKIANNQTKLTKEQLELTKKQMEENYRVAIAQVKANNISAARIDWIKNLRPLFAELVSKTSYFDHSFAQLDKLIKIEKPNEDDITEAKVLQDKLEKNADACDSLWNQILLFLNPKEMEHQELISSFELLSQNVSSKMDQNPLEIEVTEEELIDKARAVLKTAWEQAKNIN